MIYFAYSDEIGFTIGFRILICGAMQTGFNDFICEFERTAGFNSTIDES